MARAARGAAISGPRRPLAAAAALGVASAASGQFTIGFDPPEYTGSATGEPLAGQDGWEVESGSDAAWLVHTAGADPYGLPLYHRGGAQFVAAAGSAGAATLQRAVGEQWSLGSAVAVVSGGSGGSGEIGSLSLEPQDESASFALHAAWSDPAKPERWHVELTCYDAAGAQQRVIVPGLDDLEPGQWHTWAVNVNDQNQILEVWIVNAAGVRVRAHKPIDWYLAGGAAGALPRPTSVGLSTASEPAEGTVIALDTVSRAERLCYYDCDRDGRWDFFDFLCFQDAFTAGAPWADCDDSGDLTFFDFLCYQDSWECF